MVMLQGAVVRPAVSRVRLQAARLTRPLFADGLRQKALRQRQREAAVAPDAGRLRAGLRPRGASRFACAWIAGCMHESTARLARALTCLLLRSALQMYHHHHHHSHAAAHGEGGEAHGAAAAASHGHAAADAHAAAPAKAKAAPPAPKAAQLAHQAQPDTTLADVLAEARGPHSARHAVTAIGIAAPCGVRSRHGALRCRLRRGTARAASGRARPSAHAAALRAGSTR